MKELSIFNQLRPVTVGFDSVFDNFERMFSNDFFNSPSNYPAYNIVKTKENNYDVEVALAGFSKKDIEVKVVDGVITIKSIKENSEDDETLYRGISYRKFTKKFSLADDMEVKGAKLDNGLLSIDLERIVPEEKKPRTIDIK